MEELIKDLQSFDAGVPHPDELIGYNNPFGGKRHTEETKKLMSKSAKSRPPVSEETRRKNAKFGEDNGFYGKTHSEETKKKMSAAKRGNKNAVGTIHTEETKEKLRAAMSGRKHNKDHKRKRSLAIKGRHWYNNGVISKMLYECPDGWSIGRNK